MVVYLFGDFQEPKAKLNAFNMQYLFTAYVFVQSYTILFGF